MNTYMYAPKDDCKHRAFWRDLYSVEEAGKGMPLSLSLSLSLSYSGGVRLMKATPLSLLSLFLSLMHWVEYSLSLVLCGGVRLMKATPLSLLASFLSCTWWRR